MQPYAEQAAKPNGQLVVNSDTALANCPTNLDLASELGKSLAFNALGESDYAVNADEPTKIEAVAYLVYPAEMVDEETGEINCFSWIVLFDRKGKFVKTTSDVVKNRIQQALGMYSAADWANGIKLIVLPRIARKSGRIYHDVKIDLGSYLETK